MTSVASSHNGVLYVQHVMRTCSTVRRVEAWLPAWWTQPVVVSAYLPPLATRYFHALTTYVYGHFHGIRRVWFESRYAACYRPTVGLASTKMPDQSRGMHTSSSRRTGEDVPNCNDSVHGSLGACTYMHTALLPVLLALHMVRTAQAVLE